MTPSLRTACIVPTRNGRESLKRLIESLQSQTATFDLLVIDSSSTDGTLELARQHTPHVSSIPVAQFNHGGTRQLMIDNNPQYDIFVFLTQDAYLADKDALAHILAPFSDTRVAAVCGRQLPHLEAKPLAQHARLFNYPPISNCRDYSDVEKLGIKTVFISNSFAAYRAAALANVGGFPKHVIFGEDMYVAGKMLLANWKVAYASDAQCFHSHNYTLTEEFKRYFDIGVMHAREPWIRKYFGGGSGEGFKYVLSEISYLGFQHCNLWLSSVARNVIKFSAFRIGLAERYLPIQLKRKIGMHSSYWK